MEIVLFFMGKAGSGKSTQAKRFAELLDLEHVETSRLLKESFGVLTGNRNATVTFHNSEYPVGEEKRKYDAGELNTSEYVFGLIERAVRAAKANGRGVVFSGSPRKVIEAEVLIPFLQELYSRDRLLAVLIVISDSTAWTRASLRRRGLDTQEAFARRLKWFREEALPTVDHLKAVGIPSVSVDGEKDIAGVELEIHRRLREFLGEPRAENI